MKQLRKVLPVSLMIWPYVFFIFTIFCDKIGEAAYSSILEAYIVLTVVVYILNIWNAFTYSQEEDTGHKLAFYDMLIKLVHIPFYFFVFVIGACLILAMVVPALVFVSPIVVTMLACIDFFLMVTSSMYGVSAAVRLSRRGGLSKMSAFVYSLFHFFFVADVISAILLFRKSKRMSGKNLE